MVLGSMFVIMFGLLVPLFPINVALNEEWDTASQQKAVNVLLNDPDLRKFVVNKNFEVWAFGDNYPQESLNEGICAKGECTLIGIRDRNADGSVDCALKTFVNVNTGQVDSIQYSSACDETENRLSAADYRLILQDTRELAYALVSKHPRVQEIISGLTISRKGF
jgi:hypothetical protein